jgi:hypothetical protein
MPLYQITGPDGKLYEIEGPEGATREEVIAAIQARLPPEPTEPEPTVAPPAPETTIGGEVVEAFKGLLPGAVGLGEAAITGAAAILPDEYEQAVRREVSEATRGIREALAPGAGYEESIGRKFGEALGSTVPFLATRGRAGFGLGAAAGAGEARVRAEEEGGMEERGAATALGAAVGLGEFVPILRILDRLPVPEQATALDFVRRAAAAGGEEFAQEAASSVAQNLIAKGLYKPEQEVFEGAAEEGAYGFGVGAFVQGMVDLALGRRGRAAAGVEGEPTRAITGEAVPEPSGAGVGLPVSREGAERPVTDEAAVRGVEPVGDDLGRVDEREAALRPTLEEAPPEVTAKVPAEIPPEVTAKVPAEVPPEVARLEEITPEITAEREIEAEQTLPATKEPVTIKDLEPEMQELWHGSLSAPFETFDPQMRTKVITAPPLGRGFYLGEKDYAEYYATDANVEKRKQRFGSLTKWKPEISNPIYFADEGYTPSKNNPRYEMAAKANKAAYEKVLKADPALARDVFSIGEDGSVVGIQSRELKRDESGKPYLDFSKYERALDIAGVDSAIELTEATDKEPGKIAQIMVRDPAKVTRLPPDKKHTAKVQSVVNDLSQGWTNKPNIKVVDSVNDLPDNVRKQIPGAIKGTLVGNDLYVVADNLESEADVKSQVFHEVLGHYGVRDLFQNRLDTVLGEIYRTNTAVRAEADRWLRDNPYVYDDVPQALQPVRAVEEILAGRSEAGPIKEPGIRAAFNRVAALVRRFLRGVGLVKDYTNNDVANILREAQRRVYRPQNLLPPADSSPRYQMRQYQRVVDGIYDQAQGLPAWSQVPATKVADTLSNLPDNLRNAIFFTYSLPHMRDVMQYATPRIKVLEKVFGYRASYTTRMLEGLTKNHAEYSKVMQKYGPEMYEKFKDVVNNANLYQVEVRSDENAQLVKDVDSGKIKRNQLDARQAVAYQTTKDFIALPADVQNVWLSKDGKSGISADYEKIGDEKFDIFAKTYGGALGSGIVRQLREQFQKERLKVYAPMQRGSGSFWLYYERADGKQVKTNFDSEAQRTAAKNKALAEGANPRSVIETTRASQMRDRGPPPVGFLSSVIKTLEDKLPPTITKEQREELINNVYDSFLDFMPSNMLRQELSSRTIIKYDDGLVQYGVLGFNEDVLNVYDKTTPRMAYQLGNLKFALPIERTVNKIKEQAELYKENLRDPAFAAKFKDRPMLSAKAIDDAVASIDERVRFSYNPTYSRITNIAATSNYLYSIAGNISSALINTIVLPMMTWPSLMAKYGSVKAANEMMKAARDFGRSRADAQGNRTRLDDQGNFTFGTAATGEDKRFFDYLVDRAVLGSAAEEELRLAQQVKLGGYDSLWAKTNFALGYVFKNSERFNREVTLLAAFRLARQSGKSFRNAAEEAIKLNNDINGTMLKESASRMYQTDLGRIILTFRTFALTQIINLSRAFGQAMNITQATPEERSIARKKLLGIYGATYLLAGAKGLPLFSAAEVLAAALMGDDDEPYDLQQEVIDAIGTMGLNGPVNALLNLDIASRTGFNGLLWRDDPKRLAELGYFYYTVEQIAGPTAGLIRAGERGFKDLANGEYGRAIEALTPAPIRNPVKAYRYATEGALTRNGLPIKEDINAWNTTMQVFGFAPADLAEQYAETGARIEISNKIRNRRSALLTQYYTALTTGDQEAQQEVIESIQKYNQANPMYPITFDTLRSSLRERQRRATEAVNGIYLPRNLRMAADQYMSDPYAE